MKFSKHYSLSSLISTGKDLVKDYDTVSFDLFDTLFIRRVHDPDMLKNPVARFISAKAKQQGTDWSWQKVQKLRDTFEAEQRAETGLKFDDHEACYPDYMSQVLSTVFADAYDVTILNEVTEYELSVENSMLVPRHDLVEWLRTLYGSGKKIYIISDIYLPAICLEKLVEHGGFADCVHGVISSADTFLAKASGKAFPMIQERFSLVKESWLHIGDNPVSDGFRPAEFGLRALVLHDASEKLRKAIVKRHINYSAGRPFWRGRALQQLMQPHEKENIKRPDLYIEGYNFLAPMIGAFVQHIAEQCLDNGITKVFFLSREGWTFKRFWDKSMPILYPEGGLPDTQYLYVSRMALAGASCSYQGLTQDNADIAFLPPGNRDFHDVGRIFGLDCQALESHLHRHKLQLNTTLSHVHDDYLPKNRLRFNELLEDNEFQADIRDQTRPKNDALIRYFENVGFFDHKNVAIVDIGWLGTIQRFLFEAIQHREDSPCCHGYLFGATRGIPYPTLSKNNVSGVIYDKHQFDFSSSSVLYARDLFEEACRAPHPTLNGYNLTEEGYELEFRETGDSIGKAEKEQDEYFAPLQDGIFDAAKRYAAASSVLGYTLADYKPWFNSLLLNKLAFPKCSEISNIRHKHHLDDFHGSHKPSRKFVRKQKDLWSSSMFQLRFNPLLRIKFFLSHLKARINE